MTAIDSDEWGPVDSELLNGIRAATAAEVDFYQENGWVKLAKLIPPALTDRLLAVARSRLGTDAETDEYSSRGARYTLWGQPSETNSLVRSVTRSRQLADVAFTLLRGRALRWYTDSFVVKQRSESGGIETPWHQDLPQHAFDRAGMTTIWIPLVECPPERGTMRFLNGSKAAGPLGRFGTRADGRPAPCDLVDAYPGVLGDYSMSPPVHLHVGDVTVHDALTIHSAPTNDTDGPRWVYTSVWFPADALYNGGRSWVTDGLDLTVDEQFDDIRFPVVVS